MDEPLTISFSEEEEPKRPVPTPAPTPSPQEETISFGEDAPTVSFSDAEVPARPGMKYVTGPAAEGSEFKAKHPVISAVRETGREFLAANLESLSSNWIPTGWLSDPDGRMVEDVPMVSDKTEPRTLPADEGRVGRFMRNVGESMGETLSELPKRSAETAWKMPGYFVGYGVAKGLGAGLRVSNAINLISKPVFKAMAWASRLVPQGSRAAAKYAVQEFAKRAPSEMAAMGILGAAAESRAKLEEPDSTALQTIVAGAKGFAKGAPLGAVFAAPGAVMAGRAAQQAIRGAPAVLEAAGEGAIRSADDAFTRLVSKGVPADEAVAIAEDHYASQIMPKLIDEAKASLKPGPLALPPGKEPLALPPGKPGRGIELPFETPPPRIDVPLPGEGTWLQGKGSGLYRSAETPGLSTLPPRIQAQYPRLGVGEARISAEPRALSLSEAVKDAGGINPAVSKTKSPLIGTRAIGSMSTKSGESLEVMQRRMARAGYDVGATPEEFAERLVQDLASREAGMSGTGRYFPRRMQPNVEQTAQAAETYQKVGVPEDLAVKTANKSMKSPEMGPNENPLEGVITEGMARRLAPDELLVENSMGKARVTRSGERAFTILDPLGWPSTVARKFPDTFGRVFAPMRHVYAEFMPRVERSLKGFRIRFGDISKRDAERLGELMSREDVRSFRAGPLELHKMGVTGDALEAYAVMREYLAKRGTAWAEAGHNIRDPLTYFHRAFEGQKMVYRFVEGRRVPIAMVKNEAEGLARAEEFLGKNPAEKVYIGRPVDVPDDAMALVPKQMRKRFLAEIRNEIGPENVEVTYKNVQAIKKEPGRFFGGLKARKAGLDGYITDFRKWFPIYVRQMEKKLVMDWANKEALKHYAAMNPRVQGEMVDFTQKYLDWVNKPTSWSDQMIRDRLGWFGRNVLNKGMDTIMKAESYSKLGWNEMTAVLQFSEVVLGTLNQFGPRWTAVGATEALKTSAGIGKNLAFNIRVLEAIGLGKEGMPGILGKYAKLAKTGKLAPMWMFNKTDTGAKATTALTAAYKAGGPKNLRAAVNAARESTDKIHYHMNVADIPPIYRHKAVQFGAQFSGYAMKQLEFFSNMSAKEKAIYLGTAVALSGTRGLPQFVRDTEFVSEMEAKHPVVSGLPALLGIDMSQTWWPLSLHMQGPFWRDFYTLAKGKAGFSRDPDKARAARRALIPVTVQRKLSALEQAKTGEYKYPVTKELVADDVTLGEAVLQAFGPKPPRFARLRAARTWEKAVEKKQRDLAVTAYKRQAQGKELNEEEQAAMRNVSTLKGRISKMSIPMRLRLMKEARKQNRQGMWEILQEIEE